MLHKMVKKGGKAKSEKDKNKVNVKNNNLKSELEKEIAGAIKNEKIKSDEEEFIDRKSFLNESSRKVKTSVLETRRRSQTENLEDISSRQRIGETTQNTVQYSPRENENLERYQSRSTYTSNTSSANRQNASRPGVVRPTSNVRPEDFLTNDPRTLENRRPRVLTRREDENILIAEGEYKTYQRGLPFEQDNKKYKRFRF